VDNGSMGGCLYAASSSSSSLLVLKISHTGNRSGVGALCAVNVISVGKCGQMG
jgi:hypothetical protein